MNNSHTHTHSLAHSLTHTLTHSHTHTLTHSLTHLHTHSISLTLIHSLTHSIPHSFAHLHTLTHYFLSLQLLIKRFGAVGCSYQVRSESQSKHIPWNLMNDNLCLPNNMRWHSCMPCGRNVHEMTCAREWVSECISVREIEWVCKWVSECVSVWVCEWVSVWVSEWVMCVCVWVIHYTTILPTNTFNMDTSNRV